MVEMIRIPAGKFVMGCVEDDKFGNSHELPRHELEVAAFELSKFPVADPELPVVGINWYEATDYCATLGSGFRLPTEAEWEYACRAGSTTPFPSGDRPDPREVNFLYDETGARVGPGRLLPVGWGRANAFGLHDMLGNVCEWVDDSWRVDYSSVPSDGDLKTIRGGSWDYLPRLLRPSWRDFAPAGTRRDNLGFRIARTIQ